MSGEEEIDPIENFHAFQKQMLAQV